MVIGKKLLFSFAAVIALSSSLMADDKKEKNNTSLGSVDVISTSESMTENSNSYTIGSMNTSTKMNLAPIDTPQSVSVVTSQQMEDFGLTDIDSVLDSVTGIEVERLENDRTRYTARGFNITNFLVDGVGASMINGYIFGDIDMAVYDHVEVTRGATGLSSNHGDPSATVNFVRKRPTKQFQAKTKISAGSWDKKRVEVDVSTPLNESKTIRARVIGSFEDANSYLDRYDSTSSVISAIVAADITDNTTLSIGATKSKDDNNGTQMGGFISSDLQAKNYDVSVNPSPDWAYRNEESDEIFLELSSYLSDRWRLKGTYTYKDADEDSEVLIPRSVGGNIVIGRTSKGNRENKSSIFDLTLDGSYSLFNKEHEAVIGANYTKQDYTEKSINDTSNAGTIIDFSTWNGSTPSRTYDPSTASISDWTLKEKSIFAATNYHIFDSLSLLFGTKLSSFEKEGLNRNSDFSQKDSSVITPYASLVYKINENLSTYVSYTTTFNPQNYSDATGNQLEPEEGINYEFGVKSSFFDGALNSSFAFFKTKKENVAQTAGTLPSGDDYYETIDGVTSKGLEAQLYGNITDEIATSIGYTTISIEDANKKDVTTYIPRRMINSSVTYSPQEIPGFKVGLSANWKSKTYHSSYPDVVQKSFAVYNLMASYKVNKKLKLSFNVNNLTDERYYNSLMKSGFAVYGAPRSYGVALEYKF